MEDMKQYLKTLEEINEEMKYYDPHKWLLNIEMEDIPETIVTLLDEIEELDQNHEFIGSKKEYKHFQNRIQNRIKYLTECVDILRGVYANSVEGGYNE